MDGMQDAFDRMIKEAGTKPEEGGGEGEGGRPISSCKPTHLRRRQNRVRTMEGKTYERGGKKAEDY